MKNTLWTFGCSFTAQWHPLDNTPPNNYDRYREWRGGNLPKVWPSLLSKNLSLNLENKGEGATGNSTIFRAFCNNSHLIQPGDIVIVGWTQILRYNLSNDNQTHLQDILPNQTYEDHPQDVLDYITVNRSKKPWYLEVISYIKIIINYCNLLGAKVFFWTSDGEMYSAFEELYLDIDKIKFIDWEYGNIFPMIRQRNESSQYKITITEETNNDVQDAHLGEMGHKLQCDIIFKYLLKNGVSI